VPRPGGPPAWLLGVIGLIVVALIYVLIFTQ
jgi:hypothetical protein